MRRWLVWGPRTLASPWRWVVVLAGLAFAVSGWATTGVGSDEPVTGAGVVIGVVIGVVVVAMGLALSTAGLLSRVQLAQGRLVFRDPWRRRTVLVEQVQAVSVQKVDDKLVWQASAPVLHLHDGRQVTVMALAGISYGQWRTPLMRRNVAALLDWWGGDPAATPSAAGPTPPTPTRRGSSSPARSSDAVTPRRPTEPTTGER